MGVQDTRSTQDADDEAAREAVREFVLKRLAASVKQPSSRLFRLAAKAFFERTEATYAFEHAGCDGDRSHPSGPVIGAWRLDAEGFHAVDLSPENLDNALRGMWYRFHELHFHIAADGRSVVMASVAGPRAGFGGLYRVVPVGTGIRLVPEERHWRARSPKASAGVHARVDVVSTASAPISGMRRCLMSQDRSSPATKSASGVYLSGCLMTSVVATAVVGVGLLLLIPAVQSARMAARSSQTV